MSKCYTNVTIINRLCILDYFWYFIITVCPFLIISACHCLSLFVALSSSIRAWGLWACSLFLSFLSENGRVVTNAQKLLIKYQILCSILFILNSLFSVRNKKSKIISKLLIGKTSPITNVASWSSGRGTHLYLVQISLWRWKPTGMSCRSSLWATDQLHWTS